MKTAGGNTMFCIIYTKWGNPFVNLYRDFSFLRSPIWGNVITGDRFPTVPTLWVDGIPPKNVRGGGGCPRIPPSARQLSVSVWAGSVGSRVPYSSPS